MKEFEFTKSIKYNDNYCTDYRIVITAYAKNIYVDFKVYEVDEQEVQSMIQAGSETIFGEFVFGAWISYKHIFPYYGEEKESSGKYHVQLSDLEDLKRWHETIYSICEMMKNNYC